MQHQPLIREKDSVYDKLKALSSRFATNPYHNIWHLFQRWQSLIKTPHSQNLYQWLADWDSFLVEAQGTGHIGLDAKTTGWEPIFGFIDAIRPIEPTFAEQTEHDLQKNGNLTIQEVISQYRGHLQGSQGSADTLAKASFATLGNTSTNQISDSKPSQESTQSQKGKTPQNAFVDPIIAIANATTLLNRVDTQTGSQKAILKPYSWKKGRMLLC